MKPILTPNDMKELEGFLSDIQGQANNLQELLYDGEGQGVIALEITRMMETLHLIMKTFAYAIQDPINPKGDD